MITNQEDDYLAYDRHRKTKQKVAKIIQKTIDVVGMTLLVLACFYLFYYNHVKDLFAYNEVQVTVEEAVEDTVQVEEPRIILIETTTKAWTEEQIIEEIHRVFPEAPYMVNVARCEGSRHGVIIADAYNSLTDDSGVFQVNEYYHGKTYRELGFTDMKDPKQNIAFARLLWEESGLQPWSASEFCWEKSTGKDLL